MSSYGPLLEILFDSTDVTGSQMPFVIAPWMCNGKRLQDSADRLSGLWPDEKVEVIGHEAITEKPERVAIPGLGKGLKEGDAVTIVAQDIGAVVAAVGAW